MFSSKYFILGRQVVSQKISVEILENKIFAIEIFDALERFCNKDWGEIGEEDKAANEQALIQEEKREVKEQERCYITSLMEDASCAEKN